MTRRGFLALLPAALGGCAPTAQQQEAALLPARTVSGARVRQSRRFDTPDRTLLLQASVGALQDLGFVIEETQAQLGVIVGVKLLGARIRAQILIAPTTDGKAFIVRATFQSITPRPGAMLAVGEVLDDPLLYQGFFEKIAQSAFLTANEI